MKEGRKEIDMEYIGRRRFLGLLIGASALYLMPGAFAEQLTLTPRLTEGPFYPDKLPLDVDNDLLIVNDSITPAVGQVTHLTGRILTAAGNPIRNAKVEIWQVDNNGAYIHSRSMNAGRRDRNFQGFGRFETGSSGEYRFRTIRPVAYPGRAPHIHVAVYVAGRPKFTTQCLIQGDPGNARDMVLRRAGSRQSAIVVPFMPVPNSKIAELEAKFDVVLEG
jgi:protocatechuate 3,4-dioxygenase beta subunit